MELSVIFNDKCSFTGNEEEVLIGITSGKKKLLLSRTALELALKLIYSIEQPRPTKDIKEVNDKMQVLTPDIPRPVPSRILPVPKKAATQPPKANIGRAKEFLAELNRQDKIFKEENEERKDENGIDGTAIKKAINAKRGIVDKETMYQALKTVTGMNREIFDMTYETSRLR